MYRKRVQYDHISSVVLPSLRHLSMRRNHKTNKAPLGFSPGILILAQSSPVVLYASRTARSWRLSPRSVRPAVGRANTTYCSKEGNKP